VSARSELLASGRLGEAGASLLYDIVGLVGVAHRFPPPDGSTSWDASAQQSVAHDFLGSPRAPKRLLDIAVRSVDDRSFEGQLEKAVLNHLRDEARSTDLGKLIVRVKELLRATDDFVVVPLAGEDRWAVDGAPSEPSTRPERELAAAIRGEDVVVPRWASSTRDAPLADRETFVRLMRSVLLTACGSLTARDIAAVLATRLDHRRVPLTVELDSAEGLSEPADPTADPASSTLSGLRAADIFGVLSDRERIILANLDLNVRELALIIETGKSQAAQLRQRLTDRLTAELKDDEDQEGTAGALMALCDRWLQQRTTAIHGTSD
jgi:hypothetical protein